MSNVVPVDFNKIEAVLLQGDLARLSSEEKVSYYNRVCESLGLNNLTKPFDYIKLNGKEVLYAKRDAADQLRKIHRVSIKIISRELLGDVYVVTAQASMPDGRVDEATGAVAVAGLRGENLANAYLKCETKAKRRVTLSICGLGVLDEAEVSEGLRDVKADVPQIPAPEDAGDQEFTDLDLALAGAQETEQEPGPGDYEIKAGQNKGKKLKDLTTKQLESFLAWFDDLAKAGKTMHPNVAEYAAMARAYLEVAGE